MPESARKIPADTRSGRFTLFVVMALLATAIPASLIDFPPGDSWTHAWTVREWAHGNFVFNDWSSAIALPQQILGWLANIGSDTVNFPVLAVLTAMVTILGCAFAARLPSALYPGMKELRDWAPLLMVVCIAPSFTLKVAAGFMTDGYYLFFLTSSLFLLVIILTDEKDQPATMWVRRWVGFACLATLATLQRTHGITVLFIAMMWVLFAKILFPGASRDERFSGWRGWLPVILCAVGVIFSLVVLLDQNLAPARATEVTSEMKDFWLGRLMPYTSLGWDRIWLVFGIFQHFGFALLPLIILARYQRSGEEKKEGRKNFDWWYVGFGMIYILMTVLAPGKLFPYLGNSLTPEGFGPRADTIALTAGHQLDTTLRILLTVLGTFGGVMLIWLLGRTVKIRNVDWRSTPVLVGLIGLAHLGLIFLNVHFFDRYLLPIIPFAYCWIAPMLAKAPSKLRLAGWIIAVTFLVWAIFGTVDSLAWTKAKWDLAEKARSEGIAANQLVGGYEPDGYFNFSNDTYPGLDFQSHPAIPWWVTRLGLQTAPVYVIFEKGASTADTAWEDYRAYGMSNGRMELWAVPEVLENRPGE